MRVWRALGGMLLLAAVIPAAQAQNFLLRETAKPGDCYRLDLNMSLQGEMRFRREDKDATMPLTASAKHVFPERVLALSPTGLPAKTARVYEEARATITVGKDSGERTLRKDRQLIVAQRNKDIPLVYSPTGPLSRQELELTSEHLDTLHLAGLLPGKEVSVGDTWKVTNSVAQALCNFEGLTEQALTCKLDEVKDKQAKFSVTGTASGIDLGALVKLTIEAKGVYDLEKKCLVALEWKQKDQRDQGPASPATHVTTTTTVKRTPIEQPTSLSDVALVSVPTDFAPPPQMVQLDLTDSKGRFDLMYSRDWQVVSQTDSHVVMRLMDRGDFLAQATITPWTTPRDGKHMSAEEFKEAMAKTPGWEPQKELQSGEVPSEKDRWIYRQSIQGTLDGLEVLQNFYLVAAKDGRQLVVAITMTPKQAERLGTRDLTLVGSLDFPPLKKD